MLKNKIYNDDVINFLKKMKNNKYDLIIADPPYNQKIDKWDSFSYEEYWSFMKKWIELASKKIKEGGSIWIFNNPYNSALTIPILNKNKLVFQNWITWYKKDGFSVPKTKFRTMQETILFFTKGLKAKNFNFDDVRVSYKSKDRMTAAIKKGILKNEKRWFPNPKGALRSDVWEFSSQRHKNKVNGKVVSQNHATPKPHDLIETIIKTHFFKGMYVLDLFSGTGTTSIISKKLKINSDGVEINKKYFDKIKEILNE